MNSEEKRPFQTWPKAMSMKSGMTGLVRMSNKSNCTAVAAACLAFTGSRCDHATHLKMPSGIGPAPCVGSAAPAAPPPPAPPPLPRASALPARSSLFFFSFSSSVSRFPLLLSKARLVPSCAAARFAVLAVAASGLVLSSPPAVPVASATGAAAAATALVSTSGLKPLSTLWQKTQSRTTGSATKCSSVGNGPMMTVVTRATLPRMTPKRHKYMRNCFNNLKTKASHKTLKSVLKKPASKVIKFHAKSQASPR
mmetsp:Transcript_50471/g.127198  ORF Transcript_50471/g.127198 Transcript_50471/m.127198 type:complete len:253 (+) Transcript_50471:873-1631(+)